METATVLHLERTGEVNEMIAANVYRYFVIGESHYIALKN